MSDLKRASVTREGQIAITGGSRRRWVSRAGWLTVTWTMRGRCGWAAAVVAMLWPAISTIGRSEEAATAADWITDSDVLAAVDAQLDVTDRAMAGHHPGSTRDQVEIRLGPVPTCCGEQRGRHRGVASRGLGRSRRGQRGVRPAVNIYRCPRHLGPPRRVGRYGVPRRPAAPRSTSRRLDGRVGCRGRPAGMLLRHRAALPSLRHSPARC